MKTAGKKESRTRTTTAPREEERKREREREKKPMRPPTVFFLHLHAEFGSVSAVRIGGWIEPLVENYSLDVATWHFLSLQLLRLITLIIMLNQLLDQDVTNPENLTSITRTTCVVDNTAVQIVPCTFSFPFCWQRRKPIRQAIIDAVKWRKNARRFSEGALRLNVGQS